MLYEVVREEIGSAARPTFQVLNPANREILAEVEIDSPVDVAQAVKRARVAQKEWATLSFKERANRLHAARKLLLENKAQMIETIVLETGKPAPEVLIELLYICDMIGYYGRKAEKFLADRKVSFHLLKHKGGAIVYHPYGVVGNISPWNFPLLLSFGDAIAALMAGNAVVIKPSEFSPLCAHLMMDFCHKAGVPRDVLQIVNGMADTAGALIDEADLISFTGSVPTGKKVMERASRTLTPVLLELGGKDPMIVLQDANLERAVNGAINGALFNSGQMCISVERAYVEAPIYDSFVQKVVEQVQKLRVGVETRSGDSIDIGPLMSERQLAIVERQVEDARARGAKILTGGRRREDLGGYFYEPTVITDVTDDMLLLQEETFGPVLPIIKVKNAEEALRLSNDSEYGLSSSIWTSNKVRGMALARRIAAGSTCINDVAINYAIPELPMGAIKQSGFGYRHGAEDGIRMFCRVQGILSDRVGMKRELHWFPYNRRSEKLVGKMLDLLFKR
ncbi:aldehyde dehydrogenase family protein [Candidatus Chlorohelix sp.]|uniref:aldehyde dehydrogenase family protein n=1 Tax=Candidatus Chlorohelix sp. TaxID=3139201 RepID=UPI00305B4277